MAIVEQVPPIQSSSRVVLLSGSRARVRSLYADSTVDAETLKTSYSASIGQNLYVAGDVDVKGYQVISGSNADGKGLLVSQSVEIGKNLQVTENAAITGSLTVTGNSNFGDLEVDNLKVNGSASIAGNITGSSNLRITKAATIGTNLSVGTSASMKHLKVTQDAEILRSMSVESDALFRSNVTIGGNLTVQGTSSHINTQDLYVKDKVIEIASGSPDEAAADGAGLLIDGADIFVTWSAADNKWHTNAGLDLGNNDLDVVNLNVSQTASVGQLEVSGDAGIGNNLTVNNNLSVTQNITGKSGSFGDIKSTGDISGSYIYGDGSNLINCHVRIDSSSTHREELNIIAGSTQSVVHPFHTNDVIVSVYEWESVPNSTAVQVYPTVTVIDDDTIEIASDTNLKGYVVIANAGHVITGSISLLEVATDKAVFDSVDGTSTYRFDHKLGTENIIVSVYEYELNVNNGKASQIIPDKVTVVDSNHVDVVFGHSIPDGGYVVFAKAGHIVKNANLVESTTVTHSFAISGGRFENFYHGFGTENVLVQVYRTDGGHTYLEPNVGIEILNEGTISVHVPQEEEILRGYVVIGKAGHIVSGTVDVWANEVHYGRTGDWEANSFTATDLVADTTTTEIAVVSDYVDTPKIGNFNTNEGYESHSWGSYTRYTDYGIEDYVSPAAGSDPEQVTKLTGAGDLFIKGDLVPNTVFAASDINLKEDLEPIGNTLGVLDQISGYKYTIKDTGAKSIGVIAQDVQRVYPELVKTVPGMKGQEEHLTVNYNGLVAVLWEAVKQLSVRVKELESKK